MYVWGGTLDLVGCTFSGNSAAGFSDDIYVDSGIFSGGTTNIDGCPAGYFGAAGAALGTFTFDGTITGEAMSYSCGSCVR